MKYLFVAILIIWGGAISAVEPDEVLNDPVLETRARAISKVLRCTQCQNESIDESNAGIARDLRLLVRERLVLGETDTEVVDYVVERYGEYVLLQPNGRGVNLILWLSGPALLLLTLLGLMGMRKTWGTQKANPLSQHEEQEIQDLMSK